MTITYISSFFSLRSVSSPKEKHARARSRTKQIFQPNDLQKVTNNEKDIAFQNLKALSDLSLSKNLKAETKEILEKNDQMVHLAAMKVLSNMTPYLEGRKKLTPKQLKKIECKYKKIETNAGDAIIKKEERMAKKSANLMRMLAELREHHLSSKNEHSVQESQNPTRASVQPLSLDEILTLYYQVAGCTIAYGNWKEGEIILGPNSSLPDYKINQVIQNEKGLQLIILTPNDSSEHSLPPIVCCRGTAGKNAHNLLDDLNKSIGQYSFDNQAKDKIIESLKKVTEKWGPAVVTGHSLGGALAQAIAYECCDKVNSKGDKLIQSIYHYNAPGIGKKIAKLYKEKCDKLKQMGKEPPKVHAFHHAGDIVFLAGGDHIQIDYREEFGKVKYKKSSIKKAHGFSHLIFSRESRKMPVTFSRTRKFMMALAEVIRSIARLLSFIFFWQISYQQKVEQNFKLYQQKLLEFNLRAMSSK